MKTFKTIMNVFGIIAASILSIFLIISLVVTPTLSVATDFFKSDSIQEIISEMDFSKLISSEMDEEEAMQMQMIEDIMDSKMMEEVMELCADNMLDVIEGKTTKNSLTEEDIRTVASKHMDEITSILEKYVDSEMGLDMEITKENVNELAQEFIDDISAGFAESLPTAEDMGLDRETINFIAGMRNGTYFWTSFVISAVLTILVMLCQVMRFKGFMWISVDYYIAAAATFILASLCKSFDLNMLAEGDLLGTSVLSTVVRMICGNMLKGGIILLVLGLVFTMIFVVGRKALKNKNAVMNPMGM